MLKVGLLTVILGIAGAVDAQCQTAGGVGSLFSSAFASDLAAADTVALSSKYYFPHLAFGGGFQTTLTYVNYSPQNVSCQTTFFSDTGSPLPVPFAGGAVASRTDNLGPGDDVHAQTQAGASEP